MKTRMLSILVALIAAAGTSFARKPNYDESKIVPYTLADPLSFADGRRLKTPSQWPERRKEILDIFAREMYGVEPPPPEALVCETFEKGDT